MQNEENESANIKAQHPLTPQQDNRVFESIPARPAPWKSPENEMRLPKGKTCADCVFFKWCVGLFQCAPTNTVCDFAPSRFRESWNTPVEPSDSARRAAEAVIDELDRRALLVDSRGDRPIYNAGKARLVEIVRDQIQRTLAAAPADNDAELLLQHVAYSGVEFDDNRMGYVVVQIDRDIWEQIQKLVRPTTKGAR